MRKRNLTRGRKTRLFSINYIHIFEEDVSNSDKLCEHFHKRIALSNYRLIYIYIYIKSIAHIYFSTLKMVFL